MEDGYVTTFSICQMLTFGILSCINSPLAGRSRYDPGFESTPERRHQFGRDGLVMARACHASAAAKTQTAKTPSIVFLSARWSVRNQRLFENLRRLATRRFVSRSMVRNQTRIRRFILLGSSSRARRSCGAKVFAKGTAPGATAAEIYTVLDDDLANFSSNLPSCS
jgi:hypothetical protein